MRTNIYWRPAPTGGKLQTQGQALKRALLRRYNHLGQEADYLMDVTELLDDTALDKLKDWRDAGMSGADELIRLIDEHGAIEVWIGTDPDVF